MPIKMSNHRVADSAHGNKHNACEDFELRFFEAVRDGPRRYEKKRFDRLNVAALDAAS